MLRFYFYVPNLDESSMRFTGTLIKTKLRLAYLLFCRILPYSQNLVVIDLCTLNEFGHFCFYNLFYKA